MRSGLAILVLSLLPALAGCQTDVVVGERPPDPCAVDADAPDACALDADVGADAEAVLGDADELDADLGPDR